LTSIFIARVDVTFRDDHPGLFMNVMANPPHCATPNSISAQLL
jgi:hypothetical protein